MHLSDPEEDQQQLLARTVYLAEQTNTQGHFIKYVVLLGALDQMQAIRLTQNFCQQFEHEIAAIREISWEKLQEHLFDFDQSFQCYSVLMLKSCGNKSTIFLLFRNNRFKQPNLFSLKK